MSSKVFKVYIFLRIWYYKGESKVLQYFGNLFVTIYAASSLIPHQLQFLFFEMKKLHWSFQLLLIVEGLKE